MSSQAAVDASLVPAGVDPALWARYLRGTRAFDALYGSGARCPENPDQTRCLCETPASDYCRYWRAVLGIARELGEPIASMVERMT